MARVSLMVVKAVVAASVQLSLRSFPDVWASRLLSGSKVEAQWGMKRW